MNVTGKLAPIGYILVPALWPSGRKVDMRFPGVDPKT